MSVSRQDELKRKYRGLEQAFKKGQAFKVFRSLFKIEPENEEKIEHLQKDEFPLKLKLLMNLSQMIEQHYPLPMEGTMKQKYAHYVPSQDQYKGTWPMFSLHNVNKQLSFFKNVNKFLQLFVDVTFLKSDS